MRNKLLAALLIGSFTSHGQYSVGINNSNYAGTNSMYLNPSSIADTRFKAYLNIGSLNHNMSNNLIRWQGEYPYWFLFGSSLPLPSSLKQRIGGSKYDAGTNKLAFEPNIQSGSGTIIARGLNNTSFGQTGFDVKLINGMMDIPKLKGTIGFGMRLRGNLEFSKLSPILGQMLTQGLNGNILLPLNASFKNQTVNMQMNAFHETALSFGKKVFENESMLFKVGGTVKYLGGLMHMGVQAEDLSLKITQSAETVTLKSGIVEPKEILNIEDAKNVNVYVTNETSLKPFIQSIQSNPLNAINPLKLLTSQTLGRGIGGDIGFTFEILDPDIDISSRKYKGIEKTINRYIFKMGASVNDIGRISYKPRGNRDNEGVKNFNQPEFNNTNGDIRMNVYNLNKIKFKDSTDFVDNWFREVAPLSNEINQSGFNVNLPMSLTLNADYRIIEDVYIGGILIQNLAFLSKNYSMNASSVLAIIPRFETKYFEASLPIMMTNKYTNFQVGLGMRAGPLVFGTDHLLSFLNVGKPRGADFYAGMNIPIYNKPVRKKADDIGQSISWRQRLQESIKKRRLRNLHKKAMKQG